MQQMQEPEGKAYSEGYQYNSIDLGDESGQFAEEYPEEGEQPRYTTNERGQQKLHPTSRSEQAQRAMAIALMVLSAAIMAISIALFALSVTNLANGSGATLPPQLLGGFIASFVLSLLLMLLTIVAFVVSTIQLSLIMKRFRMRSFRWPR